jgi:hypothetical protein
LKRTLALLALPRPLITTVRWWAAYAVNVDMSNPVVEHSIATKGISNLRDLLREKIG